MEILTAIIVVMIAAFFIKFAATRYSPEVLGSFGESRVVASLSSLARRNSEYKIFNNVILPTPDGTTQVDHIVISPFGIFVVETKNLSGWIFGGERQKRWTQSLRSGWRGSQKYQFQNPLHQNYKHVMAVKAFLGVKPKWVFNAVVFVGNAVFMTEMPVNVFGVRELVPYIESHRDKVIAEVKVEELSQRLSNCIEAMAHFRFDEAYHLGNLERNKKYPTCPRCGKQMVLRNAKAGAGAGSSFWGCSSFPLCKATRSM